MSVEAVVDPTKLVLVVDDEPSILTLVTEILSEQGYAIQTALDGGSALAAIGLARPDVVLLDMMMPGTNGWSVLEQMRHEKNGKEIPFIVMSTVVSDEEALQLGAQGCLRKPFTLDEVISAVDRATQR